MDESRKKINRFYSASFFLIAILILVFMGVLLYMGYSSQLMIKKQSPQIRTIGLIELEITTAHLWLEEVLSGDRGEDIQAVYSHFEEANKYASILLDGGKVDEMQVYLVEDSTVRSKIEAVQLGIDSLFKLSGQRFLELGETQAGTETDKIYDAVFGQFIQIAKISERALIQQQQKNTRTFIYIQKTLIFSVITFSIIVLAFFFWFERFKINKQKQLVQSDKELSQSEGRWQYALESSGDGVWNWNAQTNEVFFSKRWKEMLGYKDDEISNNLNEWEKLIHPEEKEKNQAVLNKFLKGETDFINLEHRLLCKDGTYKWILSRGKIIERLPDNKPLRIIGTHIDLTERKQVEEALKIEKEFSEKIIDTSTAIIVGLDKDHLIQLFNKGAEKITGYSKAEVIGKDWFQIFFPEELLDEMNKVWENAWGVQSHSYENPILVKSGEERMISWQATGIYDGEDSSKHLLISIGEDITERKQIEIELQNEKQFLETVFDSLSEGIVACDANGILTRFNKATKEFHGLPKEAISAEKWSEYYNLYHSDGKTPLEKKDVPLFRALKEGNVNNAEIMILSKNGKKRLVVCSGQRLKGAEGEIIGAVVALHDITESKRAADALQESQTFNKTLLDTSPDLIYVYDIVDGKNIYSNQGIMKILGYTIEEVQTMGKNLLPDLMHPDDFNTYLKNIIPRYKTTKDAEIIEHEYRMKHKNGHWCWLNSKESIFMRQDDGSPNQIFGLTSDITSRKKSVIELEKYQNKLEELVRERTQELEDKNSLLERTNKAFVGRELRMAELKKEIEKLKGTSSGSV